MDWRKALIKGELKKLMDEAKRITEDAVAADLDTMKPEELLKESEEKIIKKLMISSQRSKRQKKSTRLEKSFVV